MDKPQLPAADFQASNCRKSRLPSWNSAIRPLRKATDHLSHRPCAMWVTAEVFAAQANRPTTSAFCKQTSMAGSRPLS
jgi:hypothetical protein